MEPDTEVIINAFDRHLLRHTQPTLTKSQRTVLAGCLSQQRSTYSDMANASGYTANSLRDAGSNLFAVVAAVIGRRVIKATCGQALRDWYERETAFENNPMCGREDDLRRLVDALTLEGRRLLCLSGPPRMGKTYLVGRLCQHLQSTEGYEALISCSANVAPTIESLYHNVLNHLGANHQPVGISAIAGLVNLLETHKLLLVIEKLEVLHESDTLGGRFKAESAGYEAWLRTLLDRPSLRSCVVVACRMPPQCLQTSHDMLFHHPLQGLKASAAEQLLRDQGLNHYQGSQLAQLAQFCGYNPGVLVAAAYKILNSGDRTLAEFIRDPLAIPYGDDQLWQETWKDLTEYERELMGWLLLHPDVSIRREGPSGGLRGLRSRSWASVIQSLRHRGFVDVDADGAYFIQTDWLRHVTQHNLAVQLATAFEQEDFQALSWHPVVVPQAPHWRLHRQWQYVLHPLGEHLERLNRDSWTTEHRKHKINAMLDGVRAQPDRPHHYTVGNLLNMAIALQVPLSQLNLTGLALSHADLGPAPPQAVNLTGCAITATVLPIALHGTLTATMAANGKTIAIGDQEGRVLCWHRTHYAIYYIAHQSRSSY